VRKKQRQSLFKPDWAPCSSLLFNWRNPWEMPVPQLFLPLSAAGSLFFSKITLILAK
jgi:hypothetical protein